jgi:hypothetical protein
MRLKLSEVFGKGLQRLWRTASAKDGGANLGWQAINVLWIVSIFRVIVAAFC